MEPKELPKEKIDEIDKYQNLINELESFQREYFYRKSFEKIITELKNNKDNLYKIICSKNHEIDKLKKNYQDEINANLKKIKQLEEKNLSLNNDLKNKELELEEKCKSLKNNLKEKEKSLNEVISKEKSLTKDLEEKNKTVNILQNELQTKTQQMDDLIKNVGEIKDNNKRLIDIEKEKKNIVEENINLRQQNENLLNNTATKKELLGLEDLRDFYDVIIEIDSINTLNKTGWKINYNEKRKDIYDKIIKEETIKIGILGLNNIGKTFILRQISGDKNLPSGWSIETKGISIKYTEGVENTIKGICLLDSAGIETPLLKNEIDENKEEKNDNDDNKNKNDVDKNLSIIEKIQEIAKDKGQTERFIEELIISLSDMLILVVGKLTRREQNFISRIKDIVNEKENNQFKSIIIIHNLAQYNEIIEVEKHISNILKKSATFTISPKKVTGIDNLKEDKFFYTEDDGTDHYIMAREGSNAGNEFNWLTIELIKRKFNDCKVRKKIDIPLEIINLFSKMSKDIIEDNIDVKNIHISEDKTTIIMGDDNKRGIKKKDIKCQKAYMDEMGKYNSLSNKFIPKHSYYAYKEKNNYILLIRVEIPGKLENLTASYLKYGKKNTIQIKGYKEKDDFPEMKKKNFINVYDNRNYEDLRYLIELDESIELNQETPIENTKIYEFEFKTNNIEQSLKNKDYDEDDDEDEEDGEKTSDKKEENIKIASGIYIFKFTITQTSWKNLNKKYKKYNNFNEK